MESYYGTMAAYQYDGSMATYESIDLGEEGQMPMATGVLPPSNEVMPRMRLVVNRGDTRFYLFLDKCFGSTSYGIGWKN